MVNSMTGFSQKNLILKNLTYTIEIKSLNSKGSEINYKSCQRFRQYELEVKNLLQKKLIRGKIDIYIFQINNNSTDSYNVESIESRYKKLSELAKKLNTSEEGLFTYVLNNNDITVETLSEEDEKLFFLHIDTQIKELISYRSTEGKSIYIDISQNIKNIESLLLEIEAIKQDRLNIKRQKIIEDLKSLNKEIEYNKSRFEEEMIYYIEKMDINEEISRLKHHLTLFKNTIEHNDSIGKKLGFITQEIGREINTLGSKSYDHIMQHIVVNMKDSLEKIKEQIGNIL